MMWPRHTASWHPKILAKLEAVTARGAQTQFTEVLSEIIRLWLTHKKQWRSGRPDYWYSQLEDIKGRNYVA